MYKTQTIQNILTYTFPGKIIKNNEKSTGVNALAMCNMTLLSCSHIIFQKRREIVLLFIAYGICWHSLGKKRSVVCIRHPTLGYDERAKIGQAAQHIT